MQLPKIQYIEYGDKHKSFSNEGIKHSKLSEPDSLDYYSINIIDLSDDELWRDTSGRGTLSELDSDDDIDNLATMISESKTCKIIVILPLDCKVLYSFRKGVRQFECFKRLKSEAFPFLIKYIDELIGYFSESICFYEPTKTTIGDLQYKSDFCFKEKALFDYVPITKSEGSDKPTTIEKERNIISSLHIETFEQLLMFLDKLKLISMKKDIPDWIKEIHMFDDEEQFARIEAQNEIIKKSEAVISASEKKLKENNRFKSILYTNGDELVEVIFEILERILSCDLSEFKDEKEEDFLIQLSDVSFIGEIKGVTSNIRSEHITQLDMHYQGYGDKLEDEKRTENVKALLIINHQRKNPLNDRVEVHNKQIALAKRNESLIMETYELLKLFEAFDNDLVSSEQIVDRFTKETGLFKFVG